VTKQLKRTLIKVECRKLTRYEGDLLVLGMYQQTKRLPERYASLDKATGGAISGLLKLGDFGGKVNETAVLYVSGKVACKRIMLVGLGLEKKLNIKTLRQAAGAAVRLADKLGTGRLGLALHGLAEGKIDSARMGQAISEGAITGRYDFKDYISKKNNNDKESALMRVAMVELAAPLAKKLSQGCRVGIALAEAENRTRMVANQPGNEINPPTLAREAQKLARQFGLKCKIFDQRRLEAMKMNGIVAVGSGSASKPRLIVLKYQGRKDRPATPDLVVVGKAITFDSGGISIKPSANMEAMKFDKCGGCAVLGIMTAAADLKLKLNVVGLIPSAENLPSHTSYRPGDIIRTYSGKTVEIQNTDAEGRMILCDALTYATRMKPRAIIDMATLTGGCVIALGEHYAGLFSNNDALRDKVQKAGELSGNTVWPLPCDEGYLEQMKSKIADLKNVGGREGAACTAAAFLQEFVGDIPWVHLDIAGVADSDKEKPYRSVGATGFAVRLVMEYLLGGRN